VFSTNPTRLQQASAAFLFDFSRTIPGGPFSSSLISSTARLGHFTELETALDHNSRFHWEHFGQGATGVLSGTRAFIIINSPVLPTGPFVDNLLLGFSKAEAALAPHWLWHQFVLYEPFRPPLASG